MISRGIVRYAIVGVSVAALYVALYAGFLALGMAQMLANGLAFLLAVAMQYFGQAGFTFGAPWRDGAQGMRFGVMISLGLVSSAVITGLVGPAFGWPVLAASGVVTLVLPIQNYLIMSRWVFHSGHDPLEKHQ